MGGDWCWYGIRSMLACVSRYAISWGRCITMASQPVGQSVSHSLICSRGEHYHLNSFACDNRYRLRGKRWIDSFSESGK